MLTFIINAIKIIFVLGFLILIHESGHFLVAKLFKVKVDQFSIGFGKKLISKQKGETLYVIRMIPLGGFVSMLGEEERSDDERSFSKQSIPKRIAICAAGGLVNIIFGLLVYFILIFALGNFSSKTIDSVEDGYAAKDAGILPNDEIVSINDKKIFIVQDVNDIVDKNKDKELKIVLKRDGKNKEIKLKPTEVKTKTIGVYLDTEGNEKTKISYVYEESPVLNKINVGDVILKVNDEDVSSDYKKLITMIEESEGEISLLVKSGNNEKEVKVTPTEVSAYYIGVIFKSASKDFGSRLYYSWFETGNFILVLADNVKNLFTGNITVNNMVGPIGISKTVADTSKVKDFIYLLAVISLSLGVTNLLPVPALDGGKILILLIEAIRRKPMKESTEISIQMIGFSLLILLSLYISYIDVLRFF